MPTFRDHLQLFDRAYFEEDVGYDGYDVEDAALRAEKLVEVMHLKPGDRVLDVGCAYGMIVKALRKLGIQAWGLDVSPWAARSDTSGYFIQASAHALPFQDHVFTCIYTQGTLEHIPEEAIDDVLLEFQRVAEAGYLAITFGRVDILPIEGSEGPCMALEDDVRCGARSVVLVGYGSGRWSIACREHERALRALIMRGERDPTHTCLHTFEWWINKPLPPTFLLVKEPPNVVEDVYGRGNAYPFRGLDA